MDTVAENKERRIPGVEGIWVFIGADMFFFSIMFMSFMLERGKALPVFESSRQLLNQDIAGINTLILLTSSWLVVLGMRAAKQGKFDKIHGYLFWGILCGLAFVASKIFEYSGKLSAGYTPISNGFFTFYYVLTGLHVLHVIAGSTVLFIFYRRAKAGEIGSAESVRHLEAGTIFWHMVDLLWIMLFPLLYLLR